MTDPKSAGRVVAVGAAYQGSTFPKTAEPVVEAFKDMTG
jgi:hypothetical protein